MEKIRLIKAFICLSFKIVLFLQRHTEKRNGRHVVNDVGLTFYQRHIESRKFKTVRTVKQWLTFMLYESIQRGLQHCLSSNSRQCESLDVWDKSRFDSHAFFMCLVKGKLILNEQTNVSISTINNCAAHISGLFRSDCGNGI